MKDGKSLALEQSFPAPALLAFWTRSFSLAGATLCIVGCLTVSQSSTLGEPVGPYPLVTTKNASRLAECALWRQNIILVESHCYKGIGRRIFQKEEKV